eukprot:362899-Chlamydomonas_euryale.AAC.6
MQHVVCKTACGGEGGWGIHPRQASTRSRSGGGGAGCQREARGVCVWSDEPRACCAEDKVADPLTST